MSSIIKNIKRSNWWKVSLILVLALFVVLSCSITIDSIDQPDSINGGETLTSTLHVTLSTNDTRNNTKFMVALLVPKMWNASQNAQLTFTSSVTTGTQTMSALAPGIAAPQAGGQDWPTLIASVIGNGGNLLPGWEWVAFYSDKPYNVGSGQTITITITAKMKVSEDNLSFKLGYVVANNSDGLSDPQYYASSFPGCFRVFGTGDLTDFCNPQIATVDPLNSLENDIVTLNFDAGIIDNPLSDASDVYICLKAVTDKGDTLDFCAQDDKTKLVSYGVKKWRIDVWPRAFFKLTPDQHIVSMAYYFTDKTGQIKIGKDGTGAEPFVYTFKCL